MTIKLALICLLAAVLAVGVGAFLSWQPRIPGWFVQIIVFTILLIAFLWLPTVL